MKTYTLNLSRNELGRVKQALLFVAQEFATEASNPNTSEAERRDAKDSEAMWQRLYDEVVKQVHEQD